MIRFDERLYALGESDDITVVSLEDGFIAFVLYLHHVHRSDGISLRAYGIKIADYLLLVGDGYVETFQLGIGVEYLCKIPDGWYLEVDIFGIDALVLKLLVEVTL